MAFYTVEKREIVRRPFRYAGGKYSGLKSCYTRFANQTETHKSRIRHFLEQSSAPIVRRSSHVSPNLQALNPAGQHPTSRLGRQRQFRRATRQRHCAAAESRKRRLAFGCAQG